MVLHFFDGLADQSQVDEKKPKIDLLHEISGGRVVGGTLSQLANYSDLFQKMAEGVFLLDRHTLRIVECNPAASQLLGLGEDQILGKNLAQMIGKSSKIELTLEVELKRFLNEPDFSLHHRFESKSIHGTPLYWEVTASLLKVLDYIEVIQFIAKDVTEEMLQKSNHEHYDSDYGDQKSSSNGTSGSQKKSA